MGEEARRRSLVRALRDGTMPPDVRAAAALLLMYGVPVTRLLQLRTDHLTSDHTGRRYLVLDRNPVLLPPAVSRLLDQLPHHARTTALVEQRPSTWLFPGQHAGQPRSAASMTKRLRLHGVDILAIRNATLLALATDLPAAVLSDLLGISERNAVRWIRRAARDWAPTSKPASKRHDVPHAPE